MIGIRKASGGENTIGGFLMERLNLKRLKTIFIIFILIMALLAARLWYIQIVCHGEFAGAAVSQYEVAIEGLDTRGMILDRNLQPLTGGTKQYYYIISKKRGDNQLERIMDGLDGQQIAKASSAYYVYRTEKYNREINKNLKEKYGAYVFQSQSRYADNQTACHLIGYLNKDENRGVSGLELARQEELADDGNTLTLWADSAGNIIRGIAPAVTVQTSASDSAVTAMKARSVVTTIDRRLQHVCEKALANAGEGGAAVVMDSNTGEILAWASYPDFNPNDIASYLEKQGDCLLDKVCQGTYAPGSVFKIVTAIAALESGVCDENQEFECKGEITVEGVTLKCSAAEEGHGIVNMNQAMAVSCNCYFAQLGQLTGCEKIVETAAVLGLGSKVLDDFPQESAGNIPSEAEVGPWDITNISIGQGSILVTPLQIARMTAIVQNGGKNVEPVLELDERRDDEEQLISAETAQKVDSMLREVMISGTGAGDWQIPVCGKTGTAEALWEGHNVKNCWFTGYFSAKGRNYTVTVVSERGESGAYTAMPVFKSVVDFLAKNP